MQGKKGSLSVRSYVGEDWYKLEQDSGSGSSYVHMASVLDQISEGSGSPA